MGFGSKATQNVLEFSKMLIEKKKYEQAKIWLRTALKASQQDGLEMLIVAETLLYGYMHYPICGIDWYSVLHLHPSATNSEVNTQCQKLLACIQLMGLEKLPGGADALSLLKEAKSVMCGEPGHRLEFDCRRKQSGVVDMPRKNSFSFERAYLDWEPPRFHKKPMTYLMSYTPESVPQLFDEMPQSPPHQSKSPVVDDQVHSPKKRPTTNELVKYVPECAALIPGQKKRKHQVSDEMPQSPLHLTPPPVVLAEDRVHLQKKRPVTSELTVLTPECVFHQVFDEMPQNPHYTPLDKFKSRIRQALINGLDMTFITLCEEIQRLEDPERLLDGFDDFSDQLSQFEEMGYDVEKLRGRLDGLKGIAERDRTVLDQVDKIRAEAQFYEGRITDLRSHLLEVEAEIENCQGMMEKSFNEIDVLKKESTDAVEEFVSTAKRTWK